MISQADCTPLSKALALLLAMTVLVGPSQAQSDASAASSIALSVPTAISVTAPVMLLSAGAILTVVAVETIGTSIVWSVENAADGSRMSMTFSAESSRAAKVASGTALTVSVVTAGLILMAGSELVAFIPNQLGKSLSYDEKVTR